MIPVTVSFTHAQLDALEGLARERDCSVSAIVRDLVARGVAIADVAALPQGGEGAGYRVMHAAAPPG